MEMLDIADFDTNINTNAEISNHVQRLSCFPEVVITACSKLPS